MGSLWSKWVGVAASASMTLGAFAQSVLVSQPMAPNGGVTRASQYWIDPTGQNDSDNDARAWEDFTFDQPTTLTHLRWWGQGIPALGFEISFWNQDPNTIAYQPDLFSGPFSRRVYTNVTATPVGGGLYQFDVALNQPMSFAGGPRYFVSIIGRMPESWTQWKWAQSYAGQYGCFWWMRGAHMYYHLGDNRAMELLGPVTCEADLNDDGSLDFFDVQAFLSAFAAQDPQADFVADGTFDFFDVQAFLAAFAAGCP
ncbi:MAG: hypothetical protein KJZ65_13850 [Phycisphaerales bacterium]|nr:hypothetical protein [Phycisphaerales bacterium]